MFSQSQKALEKFLDTEAQYAVVFEDDAVPDHEFKDIIDESWKVFRNCRSAAAVNLGAVDFKYSSGFLKLKITHLMRSPLPDASDWRVMDPVWRKTFLENASIVTMPYDNFLRFLFSGTNCVFSIQPPIIYSSGIESDIEARNKSSRRSMQSK